jgi:DNA repair protein RadC
MRAAFVPDAERGSPRLTRSQSVRLVAALELGRRQETENRAVARVRLRGPRDVFDHCRWMEDLFVEEFHILALDSQHQVVKDVLISRGILNSSLVHPREVFAEAIRYRSAAIVLVHNHPSGDPTPSPDDRIVTDQLVQSGRLLDIPVQDHLVIGHAGSYTSFAEAGLLWGRVLWIKTSRYFPRLTLSNSGGNDPIRSRRIELLRALASMRPRWLLYLNLRGPRQAFIDRISDWIHENVVITYRDGSTNRADHEDWPRKDW